MPRALCTYLLRGLFLSSPLLLGAAPQAFAGEADDLQRMIDSARQVATDLDRLDELKAVREETAVMRVWLDEAWKLRSEQKFDEVRVVLDRADAQAEMIRQKITAATLNDEAVKKEAALQAAKAQLAKTRAAVQAGLLQKAALEGKTK